MARIMVLVTACSFLPLALAQEPKAEAAKPQPPAATQPAEAQPAHTQPAIPNPRVKLETTLGDIVLELNADKAPISTQNFLKYVASGFYNGTIFHRVIKDFMIQGGGYTEDMSKKEGLWPPIKNESSNGLKNERGAIAMARMRGPDTATAEFFIDVVDNVAGTAHDLDTPRPQIGNAGYAVFGKVVEGMDVVDKIRDTKLIQHPKYPAPQAVTPETPVVIKSATVVGIYNMTPLDKRVAELEKEAKAAEAKAKEAEAQQQEAQEKQLADYIKKVEQETGKKVEKTASGLMYVILQEGQGETPKPTDMVSVHYTGWTLDGKKFDSSVDRGQPFRFSLRRGVIKGWLEGVALMKVGEKRKLIIPPDLAYGPNPPPASGIAPNAYLVFDIELLSIGAPPSPPQPK
jgi:FKBP-type peptidyl-prolyl cis-trans isomerase/cyclophilin family peptidyl-prolyl cis-trans isomerase